MLVLKPSDCKSSGFWSISPEAVTACNSLTELLIKFSSINFISARKDTVGINISDKS